MSKDDQQGSFSTTNFQKTSKQANNQEPTACIKGDLPTSRTDKETKDCKAPRRVDKTSARGRNTGSTENNRKEDARSILVTQRSEEEAHEDCSTNSNDAGRPNFLL
jgi:hypothetical protein